MGSNGGTANERVESAPRERVGVRVGAVGAVMVNPRLLCLLGAVLASSSAQEQELPREGKQLSSQPEQKYDLELSFPVDSVLATNVNDDRRARIDNLIQEILLATQTSRSTRFPEPSSTQAASSSRRTTAARMVRWSSTSSACLALLAPTTTWLGARSARNVQSGSTTRSPLVSRATSARSSRTRKG